MKIIVVLALSFFVFSGCNVINTLTRKTTQSEIDEAMGISHKKQNEVQEISEEQKAAYQKKLEADKLKIEAEKLINSMPICDGESDCNSQWEAAQAWVIKNCTMRIQSSTTMLIETYSASLSKGLMDISAQVIKEPLGSGKYAIKIHLYCDTYDRYVGEKEEIRLTKDFINYVNKFGTNKVNKLSDFHANDAGILDILRKLNPVGFSRASDETKHRAVKCVKDGYQNCEVILNNQ